MKLSSVVVWVLLAVVTVCQIVDAYLAVKWIDYIHEYNPACDWLLKRGEWHFLAAKACGTALVILAVLCMYRWREWAGLAAAHAVAAFMVAVVVYQLL